MSCFLFCVFSRLFPFMAFPPFSLHTHFSINEHFTYAWHHLQWSMHYLCCCFFSPFSFEDCIEAHLYTENPMFLHGRPYQPWIQLHADGCYLPLLAIMEPVALRTSYIFKENKQCQYCVLGKLRHDWGGLGLVRIQLCRCTSHHE